MASIEVKSEITGIIWKIEVQAGDTVAEGDTLIIIESMKMEIPVEAPGGGTVGEILVKEEEPVTEIHAQEVTYALYHLASVSSKILGQVNAHLVDAKKVQISLDLLVV